MPRGAVAHTLKCRKSSHREMKVGEGQEPVVITKEEGEALHWTVNDLVELLEHTPESSVGSGDAEVMVNDSDAQDNRRRS